VIYAVLFLIGPCLLAVALFYFFRSTELLAQLRQAAQREESCISELAKLEKIRHIPDVVERAKKTKAEAEARLADAQRRAEAIIENATAVAKECAVKLRTDVDRQLAAERTETLMFLKDAELKRAEAQEALRVAKWQAEKAIEEARREAREATSIARKEAKEKKEKAEAALDLATRYAQDIRHQAEQRAREIAGEAFEARGKAEEYRTMARALKNRIEGYEGVYLVPPSHVLDELAAEFGYSNAGQKLRLARDRTRLMRENGTAATCGYPDGWKKDHALKFVLNTFDGKVDTILSLVRPGNQGKLTQEIKDAFALVNKDGEVYKDARIEKEYLDSRLEEVRWATAVQNLKEKAREEQRAIREQMREEERARKEIERAIKQAAREEELVNQAIARIRQQFEQASEAEKAKLEAQLQELNVKLVEAEEKGKKALSMAQQTKRGNVYIISNVGSFGEGVYKIGLTRRLDPTERIRELGSASVPFPFDVHAMLPAEDAPALENALHKKFVERQMNKINKRKEFFRVSTLEIRQVIEGLGIAATWTMEAEASQYKQTLALEQVMKSDMEIRQKWLEEQATTDVEDDEEVGQELDEVEV
jgi:hypothetical protein